MRLNKVHLFKTIYAKYKIFKRHFTPRVNQASMFVIIAPPRTGSSHLCELLNSHPNIRCYQELFHQSSMPFYSQTDEGITPTLASIEKRNANPHRFLFSLFKSVTSFFNQTKIIGFKLLLNEPQIQFGLEATLDAVDKVVLLQRQNKLAVYSSILLATNSGKWHSTDNYQDSSLIKFDENEYNTHFDRESQLNTLVDEGIKKRSIDVFTLEYNEINSDETLGKLCGFLNIDYHPLSSKLVKQNKRNILDCFSNQEEVLAFCEKNQLSHYLTE